ncbi:MAG: type VI secretion system contractile sheath large subunit, partial [Pseudomonadota bacterium]
NAGVSPRARRDDPLRLLVLADFSAHGLRGLSHPKPLAQRVPVRVDIDNFDAVLRRMAPALTLELNAPIAARLDLSFSTMDDFHPDQLLPRLPHPLPATQAASVLPEAAPLTEDHAATLERLLGRKPAAASGSSGSSGEGVGGLDQLIQSIVAPSLVPAQPAAQAQAQAASQSAIGEVLRSVLHHPAFQSLEGTWLGVQGLVRSLDLGEDLQVHLLDVSQAELQADVEAAHGLMSATELARCLLRQGDADERVVSWPVMVGLYAFGPSAADLSLLTSMAGVAQQVAGSFMAMAQPVVLGLTSFAAAGDDAEWPGMAEDEQARWAAFRRRPEAALVHLVAPRLLLRLPYGKATDPIERQPFEEMPAVFDHDACLWGPGVLACAQLMGQAFMAHGWGMRLGERLDVEDLPSYVVVRHGEKHLLACAEANLSECAGERLLALGLMPLLSYKHRNAARVMSFQSMAAAAA